MKTLKQDTKALVQFKNWLIDVKAGVAILELPLDEDITLEIGEKLHYSRHNTQRMPCAKCATGSYNMNITYSGKSVTAQNGALMAHTAFLDCDDLTQSLWASMWVKGFVIPLYKMIYSEVDRGKVLHQYDIKTKNYMKDI